MRTGLRAPFLVALPLTLACTVPGEQAVRPEVASDPAAAVEPQTLLAYWNDHHRSPLDYVVEKFTTRKWIFLGEYHRVKHDVDLVVSLIPELHERTDVRHLALEFLCRHRTGEANRLVTAPEYSRGRTIDFFRSQFPDWSYEEYLAIYESAWRSNQRWASERGAFRLVGLHPCPDRELMHYGDDADAIQREQDKQDRYDEIMAESLEAAVLQPGVKALVFAGIAHCTAKFPEYWVGTDKQLLRMGNMIYREPNRKDMFFISLHAPFYDSAANQDIYPFDGILDRLMMEFGRDIGFDVVGTPFAALTHARRSPRSITAFTFDQLYDGYVLFATPIRKYVGTTCIEDWIEDEEEFRHYWRNLANTRASEHFSQVPLEEFLADRCAPRPDHGIEFRRRFRNLPDL